MPVKIGNSYVSEQAINYAQSQVDENSKSKSNSKSNSDNVLGSLKKQFKEVKFSVGTQPFNSNGTNNISIAPNILRQMADDPQKRQEYEALIYDCNEVLKNNSKSRPDVSASGFIIGSDGGLRMWSISKGSDDKPKRVLINMTEEEFKQRLAGRLPQKDEVIETEKIGGSVVFNESKRSRQLAACQTAEDVRQIMELLKTDLEDCEEGLKKEWCDEEEVKKVKKMIERAQKRMNELSKVDSKENNYSLIDILM